MSGTYIATTPQLLRVINAAEELADEFNFQNVLGDHIVRRLDPTGLHVVSVRFGDWSEGNGKFITPQIWRGEVKLGTPVTCEVMLKLSGRKPAYDAMIDVMVTDLLEFEPVEGKVIQEGETQHA